MIIDTCVIIKNQLRAKLFSIIRVCMIISDIESGCFLWRLKQKRTDE